MNLCLFFEGTGQGVAGKITNVTRLCDLCTDDTRQKLHLEPGLGTHFGSYLAGKIAGVDWRTTFRYARGKIHSMNNMADGKLVPRDARAGFGRKDFLKVVRKGSVSVSRVDEREIY